MCHLAQVALDVRTGGIPAAVNVNSRFFGDKAGEVFRLVIAQFVKVIRLNAAEKIGGQALGGRDNDVIKVMLDITGRRLCRALL